MNRWLCILMLLCCGQAYAQKQGKALIDSLVQVLPTIKKDTLRVRTLKKIVDEYFFIDNQSALEYARIGLREAERIPWPRGMSNFNLSIASAFSNDGHFDSCMYYNTRALAIQTAAGDKENMATTLNNMGVAEQNLKANYTEAAKYYFRSLKLSEEAGNLYMVMHTYNNISNIYFFQQDFKKALSYAFKGLATARKLKEAPGVNVTRETATALATLAGIYVELKDSASAISYYTQALPMHVKAGNLEGQAKAYTNLSVLAGRDYALKLKYGQQAARLWQQVNPMHLDAVNNLGNLGVTYLDQAKMENGNQKAAHLAQAREYLTKAIQLSEQKNEVGSAALFRGNLADLEALQGHYKRAYEYFRAYQRVQDSLFSQENKNKIAALEGEREIGLRDKQLEINRLELETQKKQRIGYLAGMLLLVMIGALLYRQSRTRRKTNLTLLKLNNELAEANRVKARFFAIISHDLRGPVASLISFLHLQKEAPELMETDVARRNQERITASAETLLENMESMLLWSKGQMEQFKPSCKTLPVEMLFTYIREFFQDVNHVSMSFVTPPGLTVFSDENYLKTIMQNLTSNSIKAMKQTTMPHIRWIAALEGENTILIITDNGPGATEEQLSALYEDGNIGGKSGLGLHLVRDLARSIDCHITTTQSQEGGLEVRLMMAGGENGGYDSGSSAKK